MFWSSTYFKLNVVECIYVTDKSPVSLTVLWAHFQAGDFW
jgi:hypothetical protein